MSMFIEKGSPIFDGLWLILQWENNNGRHRLRAVARRAGVRTQRLLDFLEGKIALEPVERRRLMTLIDGNKA